MSGAPFISPGWRLDEPRPELAEVLRYAVACIGTEERPADSNRGPSIEEWLAAAGVDHPAAWCCAGATAAFQRADPPPIPRIASAARLRAWAIEHGKILPDGAPPEPGDICGLVRPDGTGHVGIVAAALDAETIATIQWNKWSACRGLVGPRSEWQFFVRPIGG